MSDQAVTPMPKNCVIDGASIIKLHGYYTCSKCKVSYGSVRSVGKDALKGQAKDYLFQDRNGFQIASYWR